MVAVGESLGTELALVRPLLSVGQLVGLEVGRCKEGLGAMLTCMGLFSSMDSGVCLEGT
jgi:hypothetical protein